MPLCHHLRADEDIRLAVGKAFQDLEMPFLAARRIDVHAQNARGRIDLFKFAHDALRTRSRVTHMHAAAFGARTQHFIARAAVMAFETIFFGVVGERNVAVFALGNVTTVAADDRLRISAAVQK